MSIEIANGLNKGITSQQIHIHLMVGELFPLHNLEILGDILINFEPLFTHDTILTQRNFYQITKKKLHTIVKTLTILHNNNTKLHLQCQVSIMFSNTEYRAPYSFYLSTTKRYKSNIFDIFNIFQYICHFEIHRYFGQDGWRIWPFSTYRRTKGIDVLSN